MNGYFFVARGLGGEVERRVALIQRRVSAGSITSSRKKCIALLSAFPPRYIFATISSKAFLRSTGSAIAANSLR